MTQLDSALKEQAQARLEQAVERARTVLGEQVSLPVLRFNQRGRIAGSARLADYEIRLNPVLLAENVDEFMREVIPHELCHLLVWQQYGRTQKRGRVKPHGPEWKGLMWKIFALKGNACHQMDVHQVQGQQFRYRCDCGPVLLSIRRHNKVKKGVKYICRSCRQPLQAR